MAGLSGVLASTRLSPLSSTHTDFVTTASSIIRTASPVTGNPAHTEGAWVQLVAATTEELDGLAILPNSSASGTDTSTLMDVGIGGAGSEVAIVPDLQVGWSAPASSSGWPLYLQVPVYIPIGSRIAVRTRGAQSASSKDIRVTGLRRQTTARRSPSFVLALNADTATSSGTTLTAPGSLNTMGAWTELVAATAVPLRGLFTVIGLEPGTTVATAANTLVDVGVGASGSELVIQPFLAAATNAAEFVQHMFYAPNIVWRHIAAGSRLAARYQRSAAQGIAVNVYGIPYS